MYVKQFTLVLTDIIKYLQKYFKIGCLVMVTDRFCTGGLWSKVIVKKKWVIQRGFGGVLRIIGGMKEVLS